MYQSIDDGRSFFKPAAFLNKKVKSFVKGSDGQTVYFIGLVGQFWVTKDAGATFTEHDYPKELFSLLSCMAHKSYNSWLACLAFNPIHNGTSYYKAVVTTDFGMTWTIVAVNVGFVRWAYTGSNSASPTSLYITLQNSTKSNFAEYDVQQYSLQVKFFDVQPHVSAAGDILLMLKDNDQRDEVLLVSIDGGVTWRSSAYPKELHFSRWRLLPAHSDGLWLAASNPTSIHTIDIWGSNDFDTDLSIVLRDVRSTSNAVDFVPIRGISGAYLANVQDQQGYIQTKITYDNGGSWKNIPVPAGTKCADMSKCFLHLRGPTDPGLRAVYSQSDAIGLLLGVGNVGEYLSDQTAETFLSIDAGNSWRSLIKNDTVYDFSDYGGSMVLATVDGSSQITQSWDGGRTLQHCFISSTPFTILNILARPEKGLSLAQYWIYGHRADPMNPKRRTCNTATDYEWFTPIPGCVLGMVVTHHRKKVHLDCAIPVDFTPQSKILSYCACEKKDYECGWCHEYLKATGKCEWSCSSESHTEIPPDCENVYYPDSNGYRLVAGNRCILNASSLNLLGDPVPCPATRIPSTILAGTLTPFPTTSSPDSSIPSKESTNTSMPRPSASSGPVTVVRQTPVLALILVGGLILVVGLIVIWVCAFRKLEAVVKEVWSKLRGGRSIADARDTFTINETEPETERD